MKMEVELSFKLLYTPASAYHINIPSYQHHINQLLTIPTNLSLSLARAIQEHNEVELSGLVFSYVPLFVCVSTQHYLIK